MSANKNYGQSSNVVKLNPNVKAPSDKLVNSDLWCMYAHASLHLNDYGIGSTDLVAYGTPHLTKPLVLVEIEFLTDPSKPVPYGIKLTNGQPGVAFWVYKHTLANTEEALKVLKKTMEDPLTENNFDSARKGFELITSTPYMDEHGNHFRSKTKPKGLLWGFPHFVNRVIYLTQPEDLAAVGEIPAVKEAVDGIITGAFKAQEKQFNHDAKNIHGCVQQLAWISQQWALKTKRPKVDDVYVSYDLQVTTDEVTGDVKHTVSFGLDIATPITTNEEPFVIARAPINPADWLSERAIEALSNKVDARFIDESEREEYEAIRKINNQVKLFNEALVKIDASINALPVGSLKRLQYEDMFRYAIQAPIIKALHQVWHFSDVCAEGKAIVDAEVSDIIERLTALDTGEDRVYLDVTNMMLHRVTDHCSIAIPDDEQFVSTRFRRYMSAFGDAIQVGLLATHSPLLKPLVVVTQVTDNTVTDGPVINAADLLARENETFKS